MYGLFLRVSNGGIGKWEFLSCFGVEKVWVSDLGARSVSFNGKRDIFWGYEFRIFKSFHFILGIWDFFLNTMTISITNLLTNLLTN